MATDAPTRPDEDATYPPEPWHLGGTMHLSLWRVPVDALPTTYHAALPTGARPVTLGGHALVGTAFVAYDPGGVLVYDELLCATLTWHRARPRVTISDIWVDSPASLAGGRELWGIPKDLARFTREQRGRELHLAAAAGDQVLATATATPGTRLPGSWPLPMPTAQRLDGREHVSPVRALGRVATCHLDWRFPADGPLGFLAGRRPVVGVRLEDVALAFGAARREA